MAAIMARNWINKMFDIGTALGIPSSDFESRLYWTSIRIPIIFLLFFFRLKKKVAERATYMSLLEHPFLQHHALVNRVNFIEIVQTCNLRLDSNIESKSLNNPFI